MAHKKRVPLTLEEKKMIFQWTEGHPNETWEQSIHWEVGSKNLEIYGILLPQTVKREKFRSRNKSSQLVPVKIRAIVSDSSGDILAEIDISGSNWKCFPLAK